jgi:hypothetical protein
MLGELIGRDDLHMGTLRRQTTTWMLEIHIKVLKAPAWTTHSYALQVRPKVKKF